MFNVTDAELDGMEGVERPRAEAPRSAAGYGMPIAGVGQAAAPAPDPVQASSSLPIAAPQASGGVASGAGKALVLVAVGMVGGGLAGGIWGAAAGVAGMGALRNLVRTKQIFASPDPTLRSEAGKSATMGVFGLGIAAMLGYQAYKVKRGDAEEFSS